LFAITVFVSEAEVVFAVTVFTLLLNETGLFDGRIIELSSDAVMLPLITIVELELSVVVISLSDRSTVSILFCSVVLPLSLFANSCLSGFCFDLFYSIW